ncbi:MAG: putative porin [Chitinophagales bacterium]
MWHAVAFAQVDSTLIDITRTGTWYDISLAHVQYFTAQNFGNYQEVDTSLDNFQVYHPARKDIFEHVWLGNLGSPEMSRWFEYTRTIGFDYGRHERDVYLITPDKVKYYRCNIPYTDLFYVVGNNSEQLFHVTHAHNFGPDVNVSIDFEKIASTGYYQYASNTYSNVALSDGVYRHERQICNCMPPASG